MLPGTTTQHFPEAVTCPVCCLNGLLWARRSHGPCLQVGQLNPHRLFTHQDGQNREAESLLLTSMFPSLFLSLSHTYTHTRTLSHTHTFTHTHPTVMKDTAAAANKTLQSCLTLCDPIDGSPPGSPVPGILQARTLQWVAIPFSNA